MVKDYFDKNADKHDNPSDYMVESDMKDSFEGTSRIKNGISPPDMDDVYSLQKGINNYEKKCRYETIVRIITQNVHKSLDLEEVINCAVDVMNKHIESAQNVSIYMVDDGVAVLKCYRGYPVK